MSSVDHPPVAIGGLAEMADVGDLGMDVENRRAGDQAHGLTFGTAAFDPRDAAP